ncbi:capsule biosynthesis protein [Pararhodobacter oceanensis]|uniref:Capsule biosynthesis protein n=1 Tax=Pararhodobacter oceanensis TaxID=2172121 RepID=A0A2T8HPQ7_9RHOB|nr:capsule biosynthesis protein [Pararhodobacter oceanensis]PVH27272.1 capsule biosynthesis protein [Pararhodobacter oceanensis]
MLYSFLLFVILPVSLFAIYSVFATDRYAAGSSFVVRSSTSNSGGGGGELLDSLTGSVSSGSTKSDSYIVRRYIESPDLVREIDQAFGMHNLFGRDTIDLFQRLPADATFEDKIDYWNRRALSTYDHTTGILTLEVQAYTADEAKVLADFVMEHIRNFVNDLSRSARMTSYDFALRELEVAEVKLNEAQALLTAFRVENRIADPSMSANRDDMLVFELNRIIMEERANLSVLSERPHQDFNAEQLRRRIIALEMQRDQLREGISDTQSSGGTITAEIMNDYEELALGVEIAKLRYMAMLESMEGARREADRQQRYLAVFAEPYAAEEAAYPRRIINVLIAFVAITLIWAIASFVIQMVRDHQK